MSKKAAATGKETNTPAIKLSLPQIKRELREYDKDTLISILLDCYKMSGDVKDYLHILLKPEEAIAELHSKARRVIENEFFPEKGEGKLRFSKARKAISTFRKLSGDERLTLDLMVYYVELGVKFTDSYGDIDEPFYNSIESMFQSVASKIRGNEELFWAYNKRMEKLVRICQPIGWGFGDNMSYIYYDLESEFTDMVEED